MNDPIQAAIAAKGLSAPRVTPADVQASIKSEFYFTAADGVMGASELGTRPAGRAESLNRLTFCVLVLDNGFTVTGESACASPANFDPEVGRLAARRSAETKIWPLLGFRLRDQLAAADAPTGTAVSGPPAGAAPITAFRDGVVQTAASVEAFGASTWFLVNLQLNGALSEKLSDVQRARVYRNTYCNADGSIAGTSAPPLVFQQGGTVAETELLNRCNVSPRAFEVEQGPVEGRPFGGYILGRQRLADVIGGGVTVLSVRAQSWPDFDAYCRRVGAELRARSRGA
ncbi:Gp49 family protein [Tahibacter harae]|uniref:Gp49 family protein n=1 Tax=Tahibacter harae TaxID=2963937 RepID=A0ABT1QS48_9GAMM|nr:Gp49 family protein [Tahibacter harae]MCQ4165127.1 Gp49 family protein [Tahibacter harae]